MLRAPTYSNQVFLQLCLHVLCSVELASNRVFLRCIYVHLCECWRATCSRKAWAARLASARGARASCRSRRALVRQKRETTMYAWYIMYACWIADVCGCTNTGYTTTGLNTLFARIHPPTRGFEHGFGAARNASRGQGGGHVYIYIYTYIYIYMYTYTHIICV